MDKLDLENKKNELNELEETFELCVMKRDKIYTRIKDRHYAPSDDLENELIKILNTIRTMKYEMQDLRIDISEL